MISELNYFKKRLINNKIHQKKDVTPFPKNALIELSNACNHFCIFCNNPRMKRKINNLDVEVFKNFIKEGVKNGLEEVGLYATGEPFLTKNINEFIKESKTLGIKRVYLTSNGSLADLEKVKSAHENGLDSIKFSINAATKESYKIIHGKNDFDKVLNNLKKIYKWKIKQKKKLQLLCSFIYTKKTFNEIDLYKKIFSNYVEDIHLHPAGTQGGRINNIIEKISTENFSNTPKKVDPCEMLWNRIHLTCEGYLTACCVDYDLDLVYADFKNSKISLLKLWNNKIIKKLRQKHINNKLEKTLCKNCLYGTKDKFNKLLKVNMKHNLIKKTSDVEERTNIVSNVS